MDKRLLKTSGRGLGLYKFTDPITGSWTEWVPMPPPAPIEGPLSPLVPQGTPAAAIPGGLYGNPTANRDRDRRRTVNALLEKHGLRPRGTW